MGKVYDALIRAEARRRGDAKAQKPEHSERIPSTHPAGFDSAENRLGSSPLDGQQTLDGRQALHESQALYRPQALHRPQALDGQLALHGPPALQNPTTPDLDLDDFEASPLLIDEEDDLVERIASLEVAICALYDRLDSELPEGTSSLDARLDLAVASIDRMLERERSSIADQIQSSTRRLSLLTGALSITVIAGMVALGLAQL
jgi:hypothetical protein